MATICQGNKKDVTEFTKPLPTSVIVAHDEQWKLGTQLRISSTPFALIVDQDGIVKGKGVPESLESFEWFVQQLNSISATESPNGEFLPTQIVTASIRDSA